jgi:hypothetical protein
MSTFRSRTRKTRNATSKRRGGGGMAFFSDEIRFKSVPVKTSGIPLLFINAEYPNPRGDEGAWDDKSPYYLFKQGTAVIKVRGEFKGMRTDCMPGTIKAPDDEYPAGDPRCYYSRDEYKNTLWSELDNDDRIGIGYKHAINVLDLRPHHEVEKTGRDGAVIKKQNGDPVMHRVPYEKGGEFDGTPLVSGRRGYSVFGPRHIEHVMNLELQVEDYCRSCREGLIVREAFTCPNCSEIMIDLTLAGLNEEEAEKVYQNGMKCPHCKKPGQYPEEVLGCRVPDDEGDASDDVCCGEPSRASLFDVVWYVRKTGAGTDTSLDAYRKGKPVPWVWLEDYEVSDGEALIERDFEVVETETGHKPAYSWHPEIAKMLSPYDFSKVRNIGVPGLKNWQLADFLGTDLTGDLESYNDKDSSDNGTGSSGGGKSSRRSSRRGPSGPGSRY